MTANAQTDQGLSAYDRGNYPEAVRLLREVDRRRPGDPLVLSKLGNALKRVGNYEEAVDVHEQLVRRFPDAPEALSDLGAVFLLWGKETDAIRCFERAVALRPDAAEFQYNLAAAYQHVGRPAEAIPIYRHALSLSPNHVNAWNNLGSCSKALLQLPDALDAHRRAAALAPSAPDIQWNLALTELLCGHRKEGFARYEWRRKIRGFHNPGGVPWDGTDAPDRTLTVYAEQGMGDALQFSRHLRSARARVGRLRWMCRPAMVQVFKEGFDDADEIVPMGQIPEGELSAPLMSLPHLLGETEPVPETVPYLRASTTRMNYWRELLCTDTAVRVAVAWQGNPAHRDDRRRSVPIHTLIPILQMWEPRFFSVQKKHGTEAIHHLSERINMVDLGDALDDDGAFTDTAAVLMNMDIVLTVDTAIAHLAGALGVETWTLLPFSPDFRWGTGDCTDYPTMRLFRQRRPGDWSEVIDEVKDALTNRCLFAARDA